MNVALDTGEVKWLLREHGGEVEPLLEDGKVLFDEGETGFLKEVFEESSQAFVGAVHIKYIMNS